MNVSLISVKNVMRYYFYSSCRIIRKDECIVIFKNIFRLKTKIQRTKEKKKKDSAK